MNIKRELTVKGSGLARVGGTDRSNGEFAVIKIKCHKDTMCIINVYEQDRGK